jgi:DNA-binding LacI/PurR family transcriptional regulator
LPRDLSIVGHDNQPIAVYCPVPLTSATQPAEQIAHEAVKLVLARLEGSTDPPQTKVVTGALAVRESVADIL